ncbi:MAG: hypothetical protein COB41_06130 [Proteobacteria bacterium]|nr:MAG: hypothetical protein COB41_06130 [Pseudomonadota bacterium]
MSKYIAVKIGLWLLIVFMMTGLFGWDLIDDMEHLRIEAKVVESSNKQNHYLHDLELDLHHSIDPVKEFLVTGDYRLETYFSHLHSNLFLAVKKYEENYPEYALIGVPEALEEIDGLSHEIFKLPYAVGNMEGPVILQEVMERTRDSIKQLSKQHHILDIRVNEAMRMMAGLRMDMHDEALGLLVVLLVTLLCLTYFIYSQIVLPLIRMRKSVQQVAKGDFNVQCQVKSQDEIGVLGRAFNAMGHALKERDKKLSHTRSLAAYHDKMSALGLMAGGIAHEVGNPLSAISVSLQVAQKKLILNDCDAAQTQLQIALKETARMEDIIQIILNFGRHEATPTMRNFYVPPVIKEAVQLAQMSPKKKSVRITTEISSALPKIYAAEGMLLQVLLNLIMNALDACQDKGNVHIHAFAKDDEKIIIHIKDDGHGIADDIKDDIFKPDFTSKARGEGTGLGLAISRELIHSMHGSLELISSDATGSCFQICLPIKETS